jgi:uncharacterized protein YbjT (DUF2867 family)
LSTTPVLSTDPIELPQAVLVTGASGFVGRSVVRHLLDRGFRVRALVRPQSQWPFDEHEKLERVLGDVRDPGSLQRACRSVDWVAHLAAAKSDEPYSEETNVGGARHLAEACHKNRVGLIVNVSTQSAKLHRKGIYGRTKEEADRILHGSGVPVTTLRVSVVYGDLYSGVFGSLVRYSRLPVVPVLGPGTTLFRPIHRDDLAAAVEIAALRPATRGKLYDVGGPDEVSLNEIIDAVLAHLGRRRWKLHIPLPLGLALARMLAVLPRPPISVSNVLGSNEDVAMDVDTFFREFDFVPRSFEQGLAEVVACETSEEACRRREARLLLCYVLSAEGNRWHPGPRDVRHYWEALQTHRVDPSPCFEGWLLRHPRLLGSVDAATRVLDPEGTLQKKLLIAAALAECHPASADWLLPRDRAPLRVLAAAAWMGLRIGVKWLGAPLALLAPGLGRRGVDGWLLRRTGPEQGRAL